MYGLLLIGIALFIGLFIRLASGRDIVTYPVLFCVSSFWQPFDGFF
jgi:hypothetical protein